MIRRRKRSDEKPETVIVMPKEKIVIKKDSKFLNMKIDIGKLINDNEEFLKEICFDIVARRNLFGTLNKYKWGHGSYDNLGVCILALMIKELQIDTVVLIDDNEDVKDGYKAFMLDTLRGKLDLTIQKMSEQDALKNIISNSLIFYSSKISVDAVKKFLEEGAIVHVEGMRPYSEANYVIGPWRRVINKGEELLGVDAYRVFTKALLELCDFDVKKLDVSTLHLNLAPEQLAMCGEANGVTFNWYVYLTR